MMNLLQTPKNVPAIELSVDIIAKKEHNSRV